MSSSSLTILGVKHSNPDFSQPTYRSIVSSYRSIDRTSQDFRANRWTNFAEPPAAGRRLNESAGRIGICRQEAEDMEGATEVCPERSTVASPSASPTCGLSGLKKNRPEMFGA